MRVPAEVLDRVRGVVVVGAMITACGAPPTEPPIAAAPPVAYPAPVAADPLQYASADEATRLARLDAEENVSDNARAARIADLAAEQRARRLASRIGGRGHYGGCMACGRG